MAFGYACGPEPAGQSCPRAAAGAAPDSPPEAAVLPASHRMRRSRDFSRAVRNGRRAGRPSLVIHLAPGQVDAQTLVGLVVSKQVGGSVVRHRVARKLRGVLAGRVRDWPRGKLIVVRALPQAATYSSAQLAADVDRAWSKVRQT